MSQSKSCSSDNEIEFNAYSVTILEVPGIQGLSGPPGLTGPIGPPGPSGSDGVSLEVVYSKEQVALILNRYKRLFKSWITPDGTPNGIRTAYTLPNNDTFFSETLKVFVNGLLESGFDILSNDSFSLHQPPLEEGDNIYCEYISQKEYNELFSSL